MIAERPACLRAYGLGLLPVPERRPETRGERVRVRCRRDLHEVAEHARHVLVLAVRVIERGQAGAGPRVLGGEIQLRDEFPLRVGSALEVDQRVARVEVQIGDGPVGGPFQLLDRLLE